MLFTCVRVFVYLWTRVCLCVCRQTESPLCARDEITGRLAGLRMSYKYEQLRVAAGNDVDELIASRSRRVCRVCKHILHVKHVHTRGHAYADDAAPSSPDDRRKCVK